MTSPAASPLVSLRPRFVRRVALVLLGWVACLGLGRSDLAAQDEKAFFADAAKSLNAYATRCFKAVI